MLRHWIARPAPLIILCWLALNAPLLLGFRVLPGDAVNEFYPMVYFNAETLRAGSAPWWNPYIFSGYPQVADPQAMLFAPIITLWMLLADHPGMTWFVWAVLLHTLLGGLAFAAFLRRFRVDDLGVILGSLVFMCGGVAASRLQHVPIVVAYGFLGLALLCTVRLLDRPSIWRGAALGAAAAGIVVQPVQLTYLSFWMLALLILGLGWKRWGRWSAQERTSAVGSLLVAGMVCSVLAGPQIVLTAAFLAISNRPALDIAIAHEMSVGPATVLTVVVPNALQSLRGTYTGAVDAIETFLYIGALPAAVLLVGIRHLPSMRHISYLSVYAILVCFVSLLFALGRHTPLYAIAYGHLPGLNLFRRPSDALYLANIGLAILVAVSSSTLAGSRKRTVQCFALALCIAVTASATMYGDGEGWFIPSIMAPLSVATALAWMWRKHRPHQGALIVAAAACVVVDYRSFNVNGEFNHFRDTPGKYAAERAVRFLTQSTPPATVGPPPRIEVTGLGAVWKNMGVGSHLHGTQGYGPLRWSLYDRWYGAYGDGNGPRPSSVANPAPDSKMNALLGVRYVTSASEAPIIDSGEVVFSDVKVTVARLPSPLPRVVAPSRAQVLETDRTDEAMHAFNVADLSSEVLLIPRVSDEVDQLAAMVDECVGHASAYSLTWSSNRQEFTTTSRRPAWVAISELDFPGWVARIDGKEAKHFRANGMFRAICVPGGMHRVSFTFEPLRMVRAVWERVDAWR
ncbi:hypothetical protein [Luteibacter sp.]|uniref:hypothetical protein n=1 Tax=Luteibacter sp. TaxID=1886636 RepID=UPI003F7F848C